MSRRGALTALALALAASAAGVTGSAAAGDPAAGSQVFEDRCLTCHAPAGGGQGPSLKGIVGRKAAAAPGFHYTAALENSHEVWTAASLDRFLQGPGKLIPGTAMTAVVANPKDREDLISYLAATK